MPDLQEQISILKMGGRWSWLSAQLGGGADAAESAGRGAHARGAMGAGARAGRSQVPVQGATRNWALFCGWRVDGVSAKWALDRAPRVQALHTGICRTVFTQRSAAQCSLRPEEALERGRRLPSFSPPGV